MDVVCTAVNESHAGCGRLPFAGGIIHEAKSEIKGTPESVSSDYPDPGHIVDIRKRRRLLSGYNGRYLRLRISVGLLDRHAYSII